MSFKRRGFVTVYHGTPKANVGRILQRGLKAQHSLQSRDREPLVFVTPFRNYARAYGGDANKVIEFRIPRSWFDENVWRESLNKIIYPQEYAFRKALPKKFIRRVLE